MNQFVYKCRFCDLELSQPPDDIKYSGYINDKPTHAYATLPHSCSVCHQNPHNFVRGIGWVTEEWWGSDEAKRVSEAKDVLYKIRWKIK